MISVIRKKGVNPLTKAVLYFLQWTRIATTEEKKLAKTMARGGTYSVGEASGVLLDFPEYIIDELLAGNAVSVDGLGTFKLKVTGKTDPDPEKVTVRGAKAGILFEPDASLAARLESEAEFKLVTTPTSEGQKDADSAETPTGEGSDDSGSSSEGGSSSDSGSSSSEGGSSSSDSGSGDEALEP